MKAAKIKRCLKIYRIKLDTIINKSIYIKKLKVSLIKLCITRKKHEGDSTGVL